MKNEEYFCQFCHKKIDIINKYDYADQRNSYYLRCYDCQAETDEVDCFHVHDLLTMKMRIIKNKDIINEIKYIKQNLPNVWNLFVTKGTVELCPSSLGIAIADSKLCGCTTCDECWRKSILDELSN